MTDPTDTIAAARALIEPLTGYTPGPWRAHRANGEISAGKRGTYPVMLIDHDTYDHASACVEMSDDEWADMQIAAAAPAMRDTIAALADGWEADRQRIEALEAKDARLRGLLWYAWHEFNAIRARSGAPLTHDGMTTVDDEWWSTMTEAFADAIGTDATTPWPSPAARDALHPRHPRQESDMSDDKLRDARNRVTSLLRMAGYPDAAEYVASDYMLAEMERAALAAAPAPQPAPTETWEQCKCGPCPLHPVADHEVPAPDIDVRHLMSIRHQALVDWGNDATDDRTQDRAIADALIAAGYRRIAE